MFLLKEIISVDALILKMNMLFVYPKLTTSGTQRCTTVDFHPYGEFLASGSSDCAVKVWDIRRKQCITTFKGHSAPLRKVCFSPDGRWVVSGDRDGVIKLWDLTAGKVRAWGGEPNGKRETG